MWIKQTERKITMTLEAGTKVEVIKEINEHQVVIRVKGELISVLKTNLSEKPPVPCEDDTSSQDVSQSAKGVQPMDKRKRQGKGVHKLRGGGDTGGALF